MPYLLALLLVLCAGCAENAAQSLRYGARWSYAGEPLPTRPELADDAPVEPSDTYYFKSKASFGRNLLKDARAADPAVQALVDSKGTPDGIAVDNDGMRVSLYYFSSRTAYVLEPAAEQAEELPRRTVTETRPMSDDERTAITSTSSKGDLARQIAFYRRQMNRVSRIGYRLVAVIPPADKPGYRSGFLTIDATQALLKAMDQPANVKGVLVLWVDPEGPAKDALRNGDLIVELNGRQIHSALDFDLPPESQRIDVVVLRDGAESAVRIDAQKLPRPVEIRVSPTEMLNAGSSEKAIVINSAIERTCDDDMLAAVVGHELGHIVSGDPYLGPTKTTLAALPLAPIYFVPVVGQVAANATQGIENRYNRDQEFRADRLGAEYANAAGFDPQGGVRVLEAFHRTVSVPAMVMLFDEHPPTPERIAALQKEVERMKAGGSRAASAR